jgi:hypothetical protein
MKTPALIELHRNSSAWGICLRLFPPVVIGAREGTGGIRPNRVQPHK